MGSIGIFVPNIPIDVTSDRGWELLQSKLPEDFEQLAREHKTLETQYGRAKLESARDLLRLIFLHAGADLALRQVVSLMAECGGPSVSHMTLHKKMRLAAPLLRALVARLAEGGEVSPERWSGYEVIAVDASSFCGPGATTTDARVHLQLRLADLDILAAPIEDASVGESFKRFDWRPGQLAIGDRGYGNAPGIAHVVSEGADVLVRVNRSSLPMDTQQGEKSAAVPPEVAGGTSLQAMEVALSLRSSAQLSRRHDPIVAVREAAPSAAHASDGSWDKPAFSPRRGSEPSPLDGMRFRGSSSVFYGRRSSPRCCRLSLATSLLACRILLPACKARLERGIREVLVTAPGRGRRTTFDA